MSITSNHPSPQAAGPRAAREVEVLAKPERRHFSAEYKRKILLEVEQARESGGIGAILRREGLYFSHLRDWRQAGERGALEALAPKKRGPKPRERDERDRQITDLERANARLVARAERAEALVDLQKKVAQILGITLPKPEERP